MKEGGGRVARGETKAKTVCACSKEGTRGLMIINALEREKELRDKVVEEYILVS